MLDITKSIQDFLNIHFQSTLFDVLSLVVSSAALIFAILVPVRIAKRQNNIMLFEKRFQAYSDFLKLKTFASILDDQRFSFKEEDIRAEEGDPLAQIAIKINLICIEFGGFFNYLPDKPNNAETVQCTISAIRFCEMSVNMLPLLYSKKLPQKGELASAEITEIFESLSLFMSDITIQGQPIDDKNRTDFITKVKEFASKYSDIIEAGLQL